MPQDLELTELLCNHYDCPTPSAEYHAVLIGRLQASAGAKRRRARAARMLAAAACLGLVVVSAWWIRAAFDRTPQAAPPAPAALSSMPESAVVGVDPLNGSSVPWAPGPPMTLGDSGAAPLKLQDIGPEKSVSAASLVVRARIEGVKGTLVHYTIVRPIFGDTEAKSLDLDYTYGNPAMLAAFQQFARDEFMKTTHRAPSDAELEAAVLRYQGIVTGAEQILMFQQVAVNGKVELRRGNVYAGSLDMRETQIVDAIVSGEFLDPVFAQPSEHVAPSPQRDGATAVRATLLKVDDRAATWQVTKTILGTAGTRTVVVPHDLFRLRAEASARHAALADASLKNPQVFAAHVDAEMKKLIAAELTPQREAILVLTDCQIQGDDTHARLVERAYEDATSKHLDQVERILRQRSDMHRL